MLASKRRLANDNKVENNSCFPIICCLLVSREGWELFGRTAVAPGSVWAGRKGSSVPLQRPRQHCSICGCWVCRCGSSPSALPLVQLLPLVPWGDFGCYTWAGLNLGQVWHPGSGLALPSWCLLGFCGWTRTGGPGHGPAGDFVCHSGCLAEQLRV